MAKKNKVNIDNNYKSFKRERVIVWLQRKTRHVNRSDFYQKNLAF